MDKETIRNQEFGRPAQACTEPEVGSPIPSFPSRFIGLFALVQLHAASGTPRDQYDTPLRCCLLQPELPTQGWSSPTPSYASRFRILCPRQQREAAEDAQLEGYINSKCGVLKSKHWQPNGVFRFHLFRNRGNRIQQAFHSCMDGVPPNRRTL